MSTVPETAIVEAARAEWESRVGTSLSWEELAPQYRRYVIDVVTPIVEAAATAIVRAAKVEALQDAADRWRRADDDHNRVEIAALVKWFDRRAAEIEAGR